MKKMSNFKCQTRLAAKRVSNKFRGFTIIELMVYMGLLAIFLTIISQIFVASIDTQLESEAESGIQQDSKFIFARLQYDLANATAIVEPSFSGSSSSLLQFVSGGTTQSYQLTGVNAIFTNGVNIYQLNSVNTAVSNLLFTRRGVANGKPFITASFTLTSAVVRNSGPDVQAFETTIGTR